MQVNLCFLVQIAWALLSDNRSCTDMVGSNDKQLRSTSSIGLMRLCLHRTGAWRLVWLADPLDPGSAAVALRLLDEQVPDEAPPPVPGPRDRPWAAADPWQRTAADVVVSWHYGHPATALFRHLRQFCANLADGGKCRQCVLLRRV